jgi:glycolate oxidase iron-sulfur subunit
MIKLEQYKDSIHKCSKCGLCQEVCPIYRENGNECVTARGVLILLKGIISKELSLKRNATFYIDKCLRCGKCSQVCPSEIPIEDIIFVTKQKMLYSLVINISLQKLLHIYLMNYHVNIQHKVTFQILFLHHKVPKMNIVIYAYAYFL